MFLWLEVMYIKFRKSCIPPLQDCNGVTWSGGLKHKVRDTYHKAFLTEKDCTYCTVLVILQELALLSHLPLLARINIFTRGRVFRVAYSCFKKMSKHWAPNSTHCVSEVGVWSRCVSTLGTIQACMLLLVLYMGLGIQYSTSHIWPGVLFYS